MDDNLRRMGLDKTRARKGAVRPKVTGEDVRRLLADVATGGGVPFIDAASQAAQGNYGQAAISGLLDAAGPIGKVVAMVAAPAAAMAIPSVRRKTAETLENYLMNSGLAPQAIAYHGSPYKFEKFDISKLGTGEGAQAYGHGMYFAENPAVAKEYQKRLSEDSALNYQAKGLDSAYVNAANSFKEYGSNYDETLKGLKEAYKNASEKDLKLAAKVAFQPTGNLYKVDIPDEAVARMINWDKPLGEQPKAVIDALESMRDVPELSSLWSFTGRMRTTDLPGEYAMERLRKAYPNPRELASVLSQKGVSGVKYLDQGSRFAGRGTQNFVVFDPEIVKILERNNQPMGLLE